MFFQYLDYCISAKPATSLFLEELIINLDVKKKKLYFPFCLLCTVFIKNKHHKYLKASNVEEVPKVRNV